MRKLLVGKEISFIPEYTVTTTTPPREYGSIILANGDNVAELGIKEGWLKVREGRKLDDEQQEVLDRLFDLEDEARDAKRGMWNTDAKVHVVMRIWIYTCTYGIMCRELAKFHMYLTVTRVLS